MEWLGSLINGMYGSVHGCPVTKLSAPDSLGVCASSLAVVVFSDCAAQCTLITITNVCLFNKRLLYKLVFIYEKSFTES